MQRCREGLASVYTKKLKGRHCGESGLELDLTLRASSVTSPRSWKTSPPLVYAAFPSYWNPYAVSPEYSLDVAYGYELGKPPTYLLAILQVMLARAVTIGAVWAIERW
jgi:hypothetical protein